MLDKWSNKSFLLSEITCKQACWSDLVITGPHIAKIFQRWALHASLFKDAPFTNSSLWPLPCSFKRQRGCDSLQQFLELSEGKKKKKKEAAECRQSLTFTGEEEGREGGGGGDTMHHASSKRRRRAGRSSRVAAEWPFQSLLLLFIRLFSAAATNLFAFCVWKQIKASQSDGRERQWRLTETIAG